MEKIFATMPLTFGGASISGEGGGYGFGPITEQEAIALLIAAYEQGIRSFDTAPIYGYGLSEQRIGKAFANVRDKVFITSKSGVTWHSNRRVNMTNDPQVALQMLDQSLRDLQSDYVDLYLIHWPDANIDIRRPLEVLAKAQARGKIKYLGLCNTYEEDLVKAQQVAEIRVVQGQINFFEREMASRLMPYLVREKIEVMSWGTLDKGLLTGSVVPSRQYDASDCRSWAPWWKSEDQRRQQKLTMMEKLSPWLEQQQISPLRLAIWHNLANVHVDTVLVGVRNQTQLNSLLDAYQRPLTPEKITQALEIVGLATN